MGAFGGFRPEFCGFTVGRTEIFYGEVEPICASLGQADGQVCSVFVGEFGGSGHGEDEIGGPFQERCEVGIELPAAPWHGGNRECAA